MVILAVIVASTLFVSAMCSLFEATLYSTRLGVLEAAATAGPHRTAAKRMLDMKRHIAAPTSAIFILNTLANTAGAALAGMVAARVLGAVGVVVLSVCLTMGILFLSEILPKTYGAVRWRTIWPHIVTPLLWMRRLLYPMIQITQRFSEVFTGTSTVQTVTEDEIQASIHIGRQSGELTHDEQQLISAVFRFDDMVARQILVPRRDVVILKKGWSFDRCVNVISKTGHTRYPVCVDSLDDTLGLLHIKDLQRAPTKPGSIVDLVRPLPTIPATMKISRLLRQMQRTRKHMVLAVDERGTALGIVTMENVLEEIVGAVQDEFDTEERREISPEGRDQFIVQGDVTIDRINRDLKLDLYAPDADTLSGLLVGKVGRMLHAGDEITLDGAVAEVLEVRGDRASRVRLRLTREVDLVQRESTSEADDREQDEP